MSSETAQHRAARTRRKEPFTVLGALGELLLFTGLITLAFCAWKFWVQPYLLGNEQAAEAVTISQALQQGEPAEPASLVGGVPVRPVPEGGNEQFAVLYIPGLGDWMRPVTNDVYGDSLTSNIGHYPSTQAAGDFGNFALAGHRTGWGDAFVDLPRLMVGDKIYVETIDGWYTYEYRSGRYVTPQAVEILDKVPQHPGLDPKADRYITLQTCNPPYQGGPELFIGYGVLVDFTPRAEAAPADVTAILEANQ